MNQIAKISAALITFFMCVCTHFIFGYSLGYGLDRFPGSSFLFMASYLGILLILLGWLVLILTSVIQLFATPAKNPLSMIIPIGACLLYFPLAQVVNSQARIQGATDRIKKDGGTDLAKQLRNDAKAFTVSGEIKRENLPESFRKLGGTSAGARITSENLRSVELITSGAFFPTSWIIIPSDLDFKLAETRSIFCVQEGIYRVVEP